MIIYTIGFTKKTAEDFFELLNKYDIEALIDVRINNKSQLAGFAKGKDLKYFLPKLCGIKYYYEDSFAPTKELLNDWKKGNISWRQYEAIYEKLMIERHAESIYMDKYNELNNIVFLCSEETAENCHRRLIAEYLIKKCNLHDVSVVNL